jgi:ABC-type thiamine transport system ATPase subunit
LNGVEPFNLWRLAELPDEFQAEYDKRRAALRGAVVLESPDLSLVRGFAAMDHKAMAKMTTPVEALERKRA